MVLVTSLSVSKQIVRCGKLKPTDEPCFVEQVVHALVALPCNPSSLDGLQTFKAIQYSMLPS